MADLSNSHPVLINKKHTKTTIRMMVSFHSLQAGPKRSFPEKKTENEHQQFQEKNMNPPKKKNWNVQILVWNPGHFITKPHTKALPVPMPPPRARPATWSQWWDTPVIEIASLSLSLLLLLILYVDRWCINIYSGICIYNGIYTLLYIYISIYIMVYVYI